MAPALQIFSMFVLGALGGGIAVWGYVLAARWEGRPALPFAPRGAVPWSGWKALVSAAFFVLLPTAVIGATHAALFGTVEGRAHGELPASELLPLLLIDAATKVVLVGGLLAWLRASGATLDDLGLRFNVGDPLIGVAGFLALCVIVYPLQALLQRFGKLTHPVERVLERGIDAPTLIGMVFVAVIVAPLAEEFVFRVVLQGWIEKFWADGPREELALPATTPGEPTATELPMPKTDTLPLADDLHPETQKPYAPPPVDETATAPPRGFSGRVLWMPIVITSVVFAALHASAWPAPVPLFFLAMGLGYVYQRTHRLGPSVVMHATVNAISVLLLALQPLLQPK